MRLNSKSSISLAGAALLAIVVLSSCSGDEEIQKSDYQSVEAEISTASKQVMASQFTFNGTLKSDVRSEIGTKIMGEVEDITVNIGDKVSKGQLIIKIKDNDLEAKKQQAQAGLEEARIRLEAIEKDYNRFKALFEKGSATSKEWDDVRTQYQAAKARVLAAESQLTEINDLLTYTQIKAPYSGVIAAKYAQTGDIVAPGHPLIAVEKTGQFKVEATIPESVIGSVKEGDTLEVKIPALNTGVLQAKLSELSASGNPKSRQFQVELELMEIPSGIELRSGLFAEILFQGKGKEVITIPSSAIVKRGQLAGVYTLNGDDEALLRWIRTGPMSSESIEVLSGLREGERYVKDGQAITRDGIKVVPQN